MRGKLYTVDRVPAVAKLFVTRMLTRDEHFAVASFLFLHVGNKTS